MITSAPLAKRFDLTAKPVFAAALWLSACWHLTKRQQKRLDSSGAHIAAQIAGIRRKADEDMSCFLRMLFRTGHDLLSNHGGS